MKTKKTHFSHPGVILREEFLEPLGIKPGTLARAIGVDRARIKTIIDGARDITADTAVRLAKFFATTPGFWMNLQHHYDVALAQVELSRELRQIHPIELGGMTASRP